MGNKPDDAAYTLIRFKAPMAAIGVLYLPHLPFMCLLLSNIKDHCLFWSLKFAAEVYALPSDGAWVAVLLSLIPLYCLTKWRLYLFIFKWRTVQIYKPNNPGGVKGSENCNFCTATQFPRNQ